MVTLCLPESKSREKLYRVTCDCCKQRSFLTMEEERSAVDGAIFLQGWWAPESVVCPQCREMFESYDKSLLDTIFPLESVFTDHVIDITPRIRFYNPLPF